MKKCPQCKGKGTVIIQSSTYNDGVFVQNPPVTIGCLTCDGKGEITEEAFLENERQRKMWCECDNPSHRAVFWDDDTHPECSKHHWRCADCGKIQQVG